MKAVLCGAPKQSQGRGSHSLMVPSSVFEFTPWKANVVSVLIGGQALNLHAPIGFFPPSHTETGKIKSLLWERLWNYLRFSILCLQSLKVLLPTVLQDLSVSVIPKGNINFENRFPNLWKQLLSWKWRQPWMKYRWRTEWGRDRTSSCNSGFCCVIYRDKSGMRKKRSIVLAKLVPQNFWPKITDWTTCFGKE